MSTNQKYSSRIHTRRQLVSIDSHLDSVVKQLANVGTRYELALPQVYRGCDEMIKLLNMVRVMVNDIRDNI